MPRVPNETTLRLSISGEDWTLIETALTAYDHNAICGTGWTFRWP